MMLGKIRSERSSRLGRALLANIEGLAAIEMALILPFAVMLMSLVVYGGQLYAVQRKVTLSATTAANLLAQGNNNGSALITAPELNQILAYPSLILYPYDGSGAQVVASELLVTVNANGTATGTVGTCPTTVNPSAPCSWANANGTALPVGQQMSVDPSIASAFSGSGNNYVILGQVQYPFQPTGLYFAVGSITLHDSIMMIPRTAAQITVQ
jgi:Flp pilus assembly protein TadG